MYDLWIIILFCLASIFSAIVFHACIILISANLFSCFSHFQKHFPWQAFDARAKDLLPTTFFLQTNFIPEMLDLVAYADSVKKVVVRRDKLQVNLLSFSFRHCWLLCEGLYTFWLQGIIRDMNDSSQKLEESLDRSNPVTRKVFGQSVESERLQKEEKLYQVRKRSTRCPWNIFTILSFSFLQG